MTTDTIFETIEKQCAEIAAIAQTEITHTVEAFNEAAQQILAIISGAEATTTATPAAKTPAAKKKKTTRKAKKAAPKAKAIAPQVEAIIADATAAVETAETEAA